MPIGYRSHLVAHRVGFTGVLAQASQHLWRVFGDDVLSSSHMLTMLSNPSSRPL